MHSFLDIGYLIYAFKFKFKFKLIRIRLHVPTRLFKFLTICICTGLMDVGTVVLLGVLQARVL